MKKINSLIILILFVSMGLFGVISGNDSDRGYDGGGGGRESSGNTQIRTLIVLGAGHFLKSHSDYQQFLYKIEVAELYGVNFEELQSILNNAIDSMKSSKNAYFDLKTIAAVTPYNQEVVEQLKNFNYDGFLEGRNLNLQVFRKVQGFLSKGDITGTYEEIFSNTGDILTALYNVKSEIDQDIFPDIPGLWDIIQQYSDSLSFGQYITMIFNNLNTQ